MDSKAELIAALMKEFNRWEEFLTGLTEDQITAPKRVGSMSIKDIVSHLTTWQQINVARLEAARQNRDPEYPKWHPELDPETNEDLARINLLIHEARHEQRWADVHREWKERFLHFLELADSIPETDLMKTGKYSWLPEYPLSAVLLGSYEHHEEHLEPLLTLPGQKRQEG